MSTKPWVPGLAGLGLSLSLLLVPSLRAQQADSPPTGRRVVLPELGLEVLDRRAVQPDGRVTRTTTLADGTPVDLDELRRRDHALGHARRGQLAPELHAHLAGLPGDARVQVAFWLRMPAGTETLDATLRDLVRGVPRAETGPAVRAARRHVKALSAQAFGPRNASFARAVEATGGQVLLEADAWPIVFADVSAAATRVLARHPLVDEAYRAMPEFLSEGDHAQGTLRTPTVWDLGVTADGSVRVLVNDTTQVMPANPYLPNVVTLNNALYGTHATGVAGAIVNSHPEYKAACYTQPTLYTVAGTGDITGPINWSLAINAGIDFGNCSWWNGQKGQIHFLDRFFDYTLRTFGMMMFKSNGNQGELAAPYATTPGNGYNMICTGSYADGDDALWGGDTMATTSSYWNPIEGHDKPEVAAPGHCITSTSPTPEGTAPCFVGTSFASPLTASIATLIASGDNTLLGQMTTVKAVLMASAWHNVEGDAVMSEKDGAGGLHAPAAWATVRDHKWWYGDVFASDFVGGVFDVPMQLTGGDETRVVALWFSKADSTYSTDVLEMDVDLTVLAPGGAVVASSTSAVNPFELAAFVPPVSGTYTVRLTRQRFDGLIEPLTVAWSCRSDTATAEVRLDPLGDPFSRGAAPTLEFEDRYEGAGAIYLGWATLLDGPGFPLPGGWITPVSVDQVSFYSLGLPGFAGYLDAEGRAQANFPLPGSPNIIGLPIHFGVLVGSAVVGEVQTTSPPLTLTVEP